MYTIPIKRTLQELLALYELEPSLKDVYVEGRSDYNLVKWFLDRKGKSDVRVHRIESVELPPELFKTDNLQSKSNHDAIILLSEVLSRRFSGCNLAVVCIADTDFDKHLKRCRKNAFLQYTDYTSFEMYLFEEKCIKKVLEFTLWNFPVSASALIRNMQKVLQTIYLMRLSNESLNWAMRFVDIKGYTSWDGTTIGFKAEAFLKSNLMANGRIKSIVQFEEMMQNLIKKLHADPRNNMRGHDFTYLFFLTAKREGGRKWGIKTLDFFESVLFGFAELSNLENEELFKKLSKL
jgi:hypothetical protein